MVLTLEDGNGSPKKRNTQKASSDIPVSPAIPIDSAHTAMDLLDAALKDAEAQNQSLKVMFRKLALKHHPDKGGNKQVFQTICQIRDAVLPMIGENKPSNSEKMDLSETLKQIAEICSFSCVMNLMDAIGKEKPNLTQAELITPTIHTVESTYEHQSSNPHENRKHALEAQSNEALQEKFLGQTGDQLKTSILNDFKEQIENTSDPEELASLKDK